MDDLTKKVDELEKENKSLRSALEEVIKSLQDVDNQVHTLWRGNDSTKNRTRKVFSKPFF